MITREQLWSLAQGLGFASMGIIAPEHAVHLPNRPERAPSFTPQSVVVMTYPSFQWKDEPRGDEAIVGEVSSYYVASNEAHHRSDEWMKRVNVLGVQAERMPTVRAKTAALYAGLGVYRMNTLLYTPEQGSYHALQVFAISERLDPDDPVRCGDPQHADIESYCITCKRCAQACPTAALDGKGGIDVTKCLRFHMFNAKPTPVEYRRLMGRGLLGCDICQRVCPRQPMEVTERPRGEWLWLEVSALLEPSAETLEAFGNAFGINYAKSHRIQAQAALVAGNVCLSEFKPALERLAESDDAAVREHARWALDRIRYGCPE